MLTNEQEPQRNPLEHFDLPPQHELREERTGEDLCLPEDQQDAHGQMSRGKHDQVVADHVAEGQHRDPEGVHRVVDEHVPQTGLGSAPPALPQQNARAEDALDHLGQCHDTGRHSEEGR